MSTFNNSILLILKQEQGLDFNSILSKVSSRYKKPASAYAALSRALKNLESLGQIKRRDNFVFITDKGLAMIQVDMKEKLVMKLNVDFKKPIDNIEEIVQLLIVFSERASESNDLLQNAKEHATFTIKDISDLQDKITQRQEILDKMRSLLGVQEEKLRELNFSDAITLQLNQDFTNKAIKQLGDKKLMAESNDEQILEEIPQLWIKNNVIQPDVEFTKNFFEILLANPLSELTLYLPGIKCIIQKGNVFCHAEHKTLKEFIK